MFSILSIRNSYCSLGRAGVVGRPSVGMLGMESSPETLGAKLTVLKEGGGGSTGRLSMMVTRFRATLLLLGTFRVELELGGRGSLLLTSLFSSLLREARVFLGELTVSHHGRSGGDEISIVLLDIVAQ